jgi:hypothetical protein
MFAAGAVVRRVGGRRPATDLRVTTPCPAIGYAVPRRIGPYLDKHPKIVSGGFRIPLTLNGLSHLVIVKPLYRA